MSNPWWQPQQQQQQPSPFAAAVTAGTTIGAAVGQLMPSLFQFGAAPLQQQQPWAGATVAYGQMAQQQLTCNMVPQQQAYIAGEWVCNVKHSSVDEKCPHSLNVGVYTMQVVALPHKQWAEQGLEKITIFSVEVKGIWNRNKVLEEAHLTAKVRPPNGTWKINGITVDVCNVDNDVKCQKVLDAGMTWIRTAQKPCTKPDWDHHFKCMRDALAVLLRASIVVKCQYTDSDVHPEGKLKDDPEVMTQLLLRDVYSQCVQRDAYTALQEQRAGGGEAAPAAPSLMKQHYHLETPQWVEFGAQWQQQQQQPQPPSEFERRAKHARS